MNSYLTDDFVTAFRALPANVKDVARKNYRLWKANSGHPSLQFKRVHPTEPIYSVRVGRGWRALGVMDATSITWFWIGSHAEYDRLI
ncbi:hypothetical protein EYB53_016800 [Candidatus Chloroploca sp. M-50]|uniref:ParE-like toxin domain-containing protein n=1 Tax=Candidatus Chloroploca mongolica TaxID=2528176 RepID=A0ABS4DD54_9CHLR|nr:hypothetical protein [Candidatus Chloroploca mongolica]MBP1467374.1 hypothetical protein [Candidatus Chloroploca mongolica]